MTMATPTDHQLHPQDQLLLNDGNCNSIHHGHPDAGTEDPDHDLNIIKGLHISNIEALDDDDDKSPVLDVVSNTVEHEGGIVDDKERCIGVYSNRQKILLVGEGDFSLASCLATAFGTASNIVATSLNSRSVVIESYPNGEATLLDLEKRGVVLIHEVDARTMDKHPQLQHKLFDRIVFNFPRTGGVCVSESDHCYIECHQRAMDGFFNAARKMLTEDGEIHVTHKCDATLDYKSPDLDFVSSVSNTVEDEEAESGGIVDDKERCIGFYSNQKKILLVGEGDFSFASCLATAFGTASNIVATSLDSRSKVVESYSNGEANLLDLEKRGAVVIHEVDAHTMDQHPQLHLRFFDRIVFNFPHAGGGYFSVRESDSWYIECHQQVVSSFFKSARNMLTEDGEIHVTHKTANPFDRWNVVELAEIAGLVLKREAEFDRWDYPGYVNKKAYGFRWDSTFPIGKCSTFMFSCKR